MSAEAEPRRSIRATKGQHKGLDQEDASAEAKTRKKKQTKKAEQDEEEYIRCVCGSSHDEAWIQCDRCQAWQHNVCMGMSIFTEDLKGAYYCERCEPGNHKELLDAMARGEKLWEERQKRHQEDQNAKKRRGRKPKARQGDEDSTAAKSSPTPEPKAGGVSKRRIEDGPEKDAKAPQKLRKVSETQAVTVPEPTTTYVLPGDLPTQISELPENRQRPAEALHRSFLAALSQLEKSGDVPSDGVSNDARATAYAIQLERAVNDTSANHKKYQSQIATLTFNIKRNSELCSRLLKKTLTIPVLAIMNSDQLASKELQRETAEMIARAEKQSILVTDDGPRLRRTHKGEELIGDDGFAIPSDETPSGGRRPTVGRESAEEEKPALPPKGPPVRTSSIDRRVSHSPTGMHIDTQGAQQSPRQGADFDINKVFSTVKSPTAAHHRRPSVPVPIGPANGPGFDPEVDRLLQDDTNESPPYSPTEESDPDIIWRGSVVMTSLADFPAVAKHAGGGNLQKTLGIPWSRLIPRRLVVAGRIDEQKATVYLCSLRFSLQTDLVVVSLHGTTESSKRQLKEVVDYFVSKKRYGVIAEKLQSNVRDTYLVPVPAGTGNYPEFMLNLSDNFIPQTRTEDMLLLVFVYRNDPEEMERSRGPDWQQKLAAQAAANNGQPGYVQRVNSIPGPSPAFSPTSPQVPFPPQDGAAKPPTYPYAAGHPAQAVADPGAAERRAQAQAEGEALARQVLGPLAASPTINFLMPQAYQMTRVEWEVIKDLYETDPRTRDDLNHLSQRLEQRPPNVGAGNRAYTAP